MMKLMNACDDENESEVKKFSWSLNSLMNEDVNVTVKFNAYIFNDFMKLRDKFITWKFKNTSFIYEEEED